MFQIRGGTEIVAIRFGSYNTARMLLTPKLRSPIYLPYTWSHLGRQELAFTNMIFYLEGHGRGLDEEERALRGKSMR
jgi:hypothetical protein